MYKRQVGCVWYVDAGTTGVPLGEPIIILTSNDNIDHSLAVHLIMVMAIYLILHSVVMLKVAHLQKLGLRMTQI